VRRKLRASLVLTSYNGTSFMHTTTLVHRAAMLALGSALLALPSLAAAQGTPEAAASQRIEVTGSNIKRVASETASPVQVITKQDIDQSGKGTIAEYLQTLTADGQGSVPFTYGRGFAGGTSSGLSLRGLGASATLVLINGRRVTSAVLADDGQRAFVDLNQIPLEAVERIEVLKDGASSIYGSDAVAGVVNIILKSNFVGTVLKASFGAAQEGDGREPRAALTHGFGDMAKDGFNVLLNAEFGKREPIYYRDRVGRGTVGVSAIGQRGLNPDAGSLNIARGGGQGWIPSDPSSPSGRLNNSSSPSFIGNVRYPFTGPLDADDNPTDPNFRDFYSRGDAAGLGFTQLFPGAQAFCLAKTNLPQNNPNGACINDQRQQVNQIQPEHETGSLFGRFTVRLGGELEGFAEVGLYAIKSRVDGLAIAPSTAFFQADGTLVSQAAATQLGANHPDNPYFGTAARLSYNPQFDTGITGTDSKGRALRFVAGVRGGLATWDFDTALSFSESKQTDTATNVLNWRVKNALLNPTAANIAAAVAFSPAYAALPAGTFWRIGENAGLNSPEMYAALLADKSRDGVSRQIGVDFKASREFGKLDGGAIGVAVGAEVRRTENSLNLFDGQGDFAGFGLTRYSGKRDLGAAYTEVLLPVLKQLELNAALRLDRYSGGIGNSLTPKVGGKWRPLDSVAVRATYARGFRAPGAAETNSLAGFGGVEVDDNARCAALTADGLSPEAVEAACKKVQPTFTIAGNPNLKPEKSQSATLGVVWDITPKTSLTADLWQIKRSGLIVQEDSQGAVDKGQVVRDPSVSVSPNDPGPILLGTTFYENANDSVTRGLDVEVKHRWDLGDGMGRITTGATWTHLLTQRVVAGDGTVHDYAGTHGNCDISNCMGSPRDRLSLAATWEMGPWRLGANVNHRGAMSNKFEQSDTECAQHLVNGEDFPSGCKVKSFTTLDVSGAWTLGKNTELFASIANLLDEKPPVDFLTYGAIGFNPLDHSGAVGRFFRVGVKHSF
jgi:iron complex outermembrane recepter protein